MRWRLRAGAELMDMEFVQFFPIGHLAPRLVGMDPIMWDPFRYKLGGRLLNTEMREFINDYGTDGERQIYRHPRQGHLRHPRERSRPGAARQPAALISSFQHIPEVQACARRSAR